MLLYSHILLIISILLGVMKSINSINSIMQYILDIMEFIIYNPCIRRKKGVNSNPRIPFVTQDSLFVNENPVL